MVTHHIFILIPILLSFCATELLAAWDGTTKQQPSSTTIDGRQYYSIETPEELAWFAQKVNSGDTAISAILSADIDLNMKDWTPIGNTIDVKYDGIFDGHGHSISGMYVSGKMYAGLFGAVDVGVIKNLVIENSSINGFCGSTSTDYCDSYAGGVAGVGFNASFQNIVNRAIITGPQSPKNIYTNSYLGGILGASLYHYKSIDNCSNEGAITTSTNDASSYVGGILGFATSSSFSITNSSNYGSISGGGYTGGIAGEISNINNVINKGLISGNHYVGGIAGRLVIVYDSKQLVNEGDIQIENAKDTLYIGGIAGLYAAGYGKSAIMKNIGNIHAISNSTIYAGGIIGNVAGNSIIEWSFNLGDIDIHSNNGTANAGGLIGSVMGGVKVKNIYNQGSIKSSHYAAGILPKTQQSASTSYQNYIDNFYVAADTIDAPNAAAIVLYNSVTATIKNGYFDSTQLHNLPMIGNNLGNVNNLFYRSESEMKSDSIAYILDTCNHDYNSNQHWSRDLDYPIFKDSIHNPIYKVSFVFSDPKSCFSKSSCNLDSTIYYTNYTGRISELPLLNTDGKWLIPSRNLVIYGNQTVSNDHVFNWYDTLAYAAYQNCDEYASANINCCLQHILDFEQEYADIMNSYQKKEVVSPDSIVMTFCFDDNNDGILNWDDPNSYLSTTYQSMNTTINNIKPLISSSSSSNDSPYSSFEETTSHQSLIKINHTIKIHGKDVQIITNAGYTPFTIFDMQGRVLTKGLINSGYHNITISQPGNYIIKIGTHTQRISVK